MTVYLFENQQVVQELFELEKPIDLHDKIDNESDTPSEFIQDFQTHYSNNKMIGDLLSMKTYNYYPLPSRSP